MIYNNREHIFFFFSSPENHLYCYMYAKNYFNEIIMYFFGSLVCHYTFETKKKKAKKKLQNNGVGEHWLKRIVRHN